MRIGIAPKLTLVMILFAAILLISLAIPIYNNSRIALQTAITSDLLSTAIEKQAALDYWVNERLGDIVTISRYSDLVLEIERLIDNPTIAEIITPARTKILNDLNQHAGPGNNFDELELLAADSGQVVLSTNPAAEGTFNEDQPFFTNGKIGPFIQSLYFSITSQAPAMAVSTPILTTDGRLLGVLVGRLKLAEMEAIVSRRTGLHQSDDSFLVTTFNQFATQPRFIPDQAVMRIGIHTQAITNCLLHSSGVLEANDYRGIPAIIVYRWLPSQKMCLIVKINQAEALAPARALFTTIALVGGLVLLIGAITAFIISKSFTRPIQQLVTGTEEMGKGNLDYRIGLKTQDEIGQLGKSFDRMAENLKTTLVSRDDLVKEAKIRKKVENKLKETTSYLENLIGYANAPIIVWDSLFRINRFNHAFETLTGRSAGEVIGKTLELLFPPDQVSHSMALIKGIQKGKRLESVEISIHHVDGSDRTVLWNSATIFGNDRKTPVATIAQGQDITERKRAEERLLNTLEDLERSNKELEQFAYVASHDLQEPLRMVASYTQLLEKRYKDKLDSDALEFINYAVAGANRMQALVNDLLSYSRIGTRGKALEPIDAHIALGQARMNLSATIEETHAVVTNDDLPVILADESQLVQLFQNLIGNAIKFHKAGESPRIHISAVRKDENWVFSVQDNGIGIEPQYFERIFVIFQRLNTREEYKGTGIGLAICKKIIERHGGRIWVDSQPGEGSTFYFTLNFVDLKAKNKISKGDKNAIK